MIKLHYICVISTAICVISTAWKAGSVNGGKKVLRKRSNPEGGGGGTVLPYMG